LSYKKEGNKI